MTSSPTFLDFESWNKLPVIITTPGEYTTRDGRRVTVREIRTTATFCVYGKIWMEFRGQFRPRRNESWHPNGRATFKSSGLDRDIVGPWIEDPVISDADFAELKQRFPQRINDSHRSLGFTALLRLTDDSVVADRVMSDADFVELKRRFPRHINNTHRSLGFTALMRLTESD
jgi:hypothetical protein